MVGGLLSELADHGVRIVSATPSEVRVEGQLTDDLRAKLLENKTELLEHFRGKQTGAADAVEVFASALALAEVSGFPVRLLADLPAPPCLICSSVGGQVAALDFGMVGHGRHRVYFGLDETLTLVGAVEARWPIDFLAYCQRKLSEPGCLLGFRRQPPQGPVSLLTTAAFLERLGLHLLSIEVGQHDQ